MYKQPTFVDVQGYLIKGRFVVKEFAVMSDKRNVFHCVFKCPLPWNRLNDTEKEHVRRSTVHHGLDWSFNGDVEFKNYKRLMVDILSFRDKIQVNGHTKRAWLREIIGDKIDINLLEFTRYDNVSSYSSHKCIVHHSSHRRHSCALENVNKYYNWWILGSKEHTYFTID